MSAPTSKLDILHSYRHLMRAGLRAVCFSKPSRFIIRDVLRDGFRDRKAIFRPAAVQRTILFLQAAQKKGFEHRLLKTLTRISWERRMGRKGTGNSWEGVLGARKYMSGKKKYTAIDGTEYEHFDRTLAMLNDTANLCLKI
ncbi:hypothetical protein V8F06_007903 [Rhypophila decipiens]